MATTLKLPDGLWDHQRQAIETAHRYLTTKDVGDASALITMPTGTGKTGVIATIVTALPSITGHRLVLTPWDALARQLIDDLRGRFWNRLPGSTRPESLPVCRLPSSTNLERVLETSEPTVFVATIAAISVAAARSDGLGFDLGDVFADFGCVLVDEGHYEPAHEWSKAIRGLHRPTVLLTATPYRNDVKYFRVGEAWRYRFPHWQAEEKRFLRTPEFVTLRDATEPVAFARQLFEQVRARFPDDESVRVIVRCETASSIRLIVKALEDLGQPVVGVHEQFSGRELPLRRDVPRPDECPARFWVHQNKLIEGIDDPNFKVLAFYEALKNDRAIVQQIGRVLRNPHQNPQDMTALVLGIGDRDIARTWDAYRSFDRQEEAESVATLPQLVERVIEAQPQAFYYDRSYRVRIDLNSAYAWHEFAFPLRTRVYRLASDGAPPLDEMADVIANEWREIDRAVFTSQVPDDQTVIIPFVTAENSRLLRSGTFIEPEFGYTIIRLSGDFLFIYDSRGRIPAIVLKHFRPLRPPDLQVLFQKGASSLTSISLLNTDIGRQAARSRHIRAAAIDDLAPDLADYAYVCTTAEGYTEIADERFRRYLGLSRSKVVDYRKSEHDYAAYSEWLDSLARELLSRNGWATTFTRYAIHVDEPDDKTPLHVLLDVDPSKFTQFGTGAPLEIEDRAASVIDGGFSITANGKPHDAKLSWDRVKERYEVVAPSLRSALFMTPEGEGHELVELINEEQYLRVIPHGRKTIYAHGGFFKPVIPSNRAGSFRLLDVLTSTPELENAVSEKGTAIVSDDWDPASVFGMISALAPSSGRRAPSTMRKILPRPDFVLCTDLGSEVADFIITQGTRVVFIHAKVAPTLRLCSASVLHDVASQAIKNLPHLQPLADIRPPTASWTRPWSIATVADSTRRLREGASAVVPRCGITSGR